MVLDLGRLPWSLELRTLRDFEREVVGVCSLSSPPAHAFQLRLRPPMLPLRLDRELETARALFTDGAERKAALDGYVRAFEVLVGSVEVLWSPLLGWGDHEAAVLADILPLCPRLRQLRPPPLRPLRLPNPKPNPKRHSLQ
jgi:hypothetical protein